MSLDRMFHAVPVFQGENGETPKHRSTEALCGRFVPLCSIFSFVPEMEHGERSALFKMFKAFNVLNSLQIEQLERYRK